MADKFLRGDAPVVAKVFTITAGGSPTAGDTITVNLIDETSAVVRTHTYTVPATPTLSMISAGIAAMLQASPYAEFAELSPSDSTGGVVLLTQLSQYAGANEYISVSKTGTVTISVSTSTASSSPSDFGLAANWTGASTPGTSDNAYIDGMLVDLLYNLGAFSQVALLKITNSKKIGLPLNNGRYREWRARYLKAIFSSCYIDCPESNLIRLDGGSPSAVGELIVNAVGANGYENGVPSLCFKSAGSYGYNVTINKGSMGIAVFAGETAVVPLIRQSYTDSASDTQVVCGTGASLTNVYRSGGKFDFASALTLLEQREQAGIAIFRGGAVTLATITLYAGSLTMLPTAANAEITNLIIGPDCKLDMTKCMFPVRCPNAITMFANAELNDPFGRLAIATPTDGSPNAKITITKSGCDESQLKITRPIGTTMSV